MSLIWAHCRSLGLAGACSVAGALVLPPDVLSDAVARGGTGWAESGALPVEVFAVMGGGSVGRAVYAT